MHSDLTRLIYTLVHNQHSVNWGELAMSYQQLTISFFLPSSDFPFEQQYKMVPKSSGPGYYAWDHILFLPSYGSWVSNHSVLSHVSNVDNIPHFIQLLWGNISKALNKVSTHDNCSINIKYHCLLLLLLLLVLSSISEELGLWLIKVGGILFTWLIK